MLVKWIPSGLPVVLVNTSGEKAAHMENGTIEYCSTNRAVLQTASGL